MMAPETDDSDCTDSDKGLVEKIRDCMGGEKSGKDER